MTLTEALALASMPATQPAGPFAPGSTVQAVGANLAGGAEAGGLRWGGTARGGGRGLGERVNPTGNRPQPRWTASGGALESELGSAVTWRAPAQAGTYTLTLIVSDGVLRVGQELEVSGAEEGG